MLTKCAVAFLAGVALTLHARADAVADFYKGRTVTLIVGYGPGGGYDLFARLMARHLGHYIPGNPTIVVQNMPGAGSLRATNYLYTVAPGDGATIGSFARDMPLLAIQCGGGLRSAQIHLARFLVGLFTRRLHPDGAEGRASEINRRTATAQVDDGHRRS
jgi:tripartite-type tricarboxylate transporter receptor subunit TctC